MLLAEALLRLPMPFPLSLLMWMRCVLILQSGICVVPQAEEMVQTFLAEQLLMPHAAHGPAVPVPCDDAPRVRMLGKSFGSRIGGGRAAVGGAVGVTSNKSFF